jgi:hypothetical protein
VDKQHGRVEIRQLWVAPAGELAEYLAAEWGWVGVAQVGWLRRLTRRGGQWHDEQVTLVTSAGAARLPAAEVLATLRGHWGIENRVHRVRDVSYDEDRLHGRQIAWALAWGRNTAMSLIRKADVGYIPDAISYASAHFQEVIGWLTDKWEN